MDEKVQFKLINLKNRFTVENFQGLYPNYLLYLEDTQVIFISIKLQ